MQLTTSSKYSLTLLSLTFHLQFISSLEEEIYFCRSPTSINSSEKVIIPKHFVHNGAELKFRLGVRDIKCPLSKVVKRISNVSDPAFFFLPTGVVLQDYPREEYFLREEYCISRLEEEVVEIQHCDVICGDTHTCIHKCCPPGEIINFTKELSEPICGVSHVPWTPFFYDDYRGCGIRNRSSVNFHFLAIPPPNYTEAFQSFKSINIQPLHLGIMYNSTEPMDGIRFRLMRQGHVAAHTVEGRWTNISGGEFCIDGMTGYIGSGPYTGKLEDQLIMYLDEPNFPSEEGPGRLETLYTFFMIVGAIFLIATSVLYLLIWEKHNIHGWIIFSYVTTMLFMFLFLAMSHIFSLSMTHDFGGTSACKSIGIIIHFFYLSTMCWLTVINVDLWLAFRNVKPTPGKSGTIFRYFLYSLFAIGVPILIVAFAISVDHIYAGAFGDGTECEPPITLPLYGQQQCYLQKYAHWPYLYIPMSILISCNILTFSSTLFTLCMYRKHTRNVISSADHQRESVILFGKLFIVTGISWVFELLSYSFPEPWWCWIIFDFYNLLQAVLIFIIFAVKRENVVFLYHKYPSARKFIVPIMRTVYNESFDPERTEMTGAPHDFRNGRISFRRGSNLSTSGMLTNNSSGSWKRRGSEDF